MKEQIKRKEISKAGFVTMCWTIIISSLLGLFITSTMFLLKNAQVWQDNNFLIAFWGISLIATGFGVGLAYSRMWEIQGYD